MESGRVGNREVSVEESRPLGRREPWVLEELLQKRLHTGAKGRENSIRYKDNINTKKALKTKGFFDLYNFSLTLISVML